MSDKTKEQLLESIIDREIHPVAFIETGKIMQQWADQDKRKEAIAYTKWIEQNAYWMPSKERWYLHNAETFAPEGYSDDELYDLYLQSLPKTV